MFLLDRGGFLLYLIFTYGAQNGTQGPFLDLYVSVRQLYVSVPYDHHKKGHRTWHLEKKASL